MAIDDGTSVEVCYRIVNPVFLRTLLTEKNSLDIDIIQYTVYKVTN